MPTKSRRTSAPRRSGRDAPRYESSSALVNDLLFASATWQPYPRVSDTVTAGPDGGWIGAQNWREEKYE